MSKTYLVITPFFPSKDNFRGPYVLDQVKALKKESDYKVVVLKPKPFYIQKEDYSFEGENVYYFNTYEFPSGMFPGLFDRLTQIAFIKKLESIGIALGDVAVVHAHVAQNGMLANWLKKKHSKIKTVVQHHGFDVLSLENGKLSRYQWHRNWVKHYGVKICNLIDVHVGVSQKTLNFLTAFKSIKPKDTYVLYNGVDTSKFYPIPSKDINTDFNVGCIANFWPLKDQMTLIKAIEKLVNNHQIAVKVKLVGTGETLNLCKAYVLQHKLSSYFEFIDEIPHDELVNFYNTLDLFVLPSFFEAFGCVYTEAYACGVPFMAVKNQGISEILSEEEQEKWLIEKGDHETLAILIQQHYLYRFDQKLTTLIDIDLLVKKFIKRLAETTS